jgi:hypothetical protein
MMLVMTSLCVGKIQHAIQRDHLPVVIYVERDVAGTIDAIITNEFAVFRSRSAAHYREK